MATQSADEQTQQSDPAIKRRGLLAAAAAVVAGIVAKLAEAPVLATSGGGDQSFLALGSNPWYIAGSPSANTPAISSAPTVIQASVNFGNFVGGNGADSVLFEVDARPSSGQVDAIYGLTDGSGFGVVGSGLAGVFGSGTSTGVFGSGTSTGVRGDGVTGVLGQSLAAGGIGVQGTIPPGAAQNATAVYGLNYSSYAGPGPGAGGFGVYGLSAKGHGLVGAVGTAGAAAVVGATNGVAGAYAGAFYGPVVVGGDFTVVGGAKSAAVPHPDGSHRRLYCMESPESWFEDFGKGQLQGGCAAVAIDPDFAAVVDLTDYHVFLTGYDDFDLRVAEQTATGFRVVAKDAAASGRFSWRIVARRKDISAPRFETVVVPPEPVLPTEPDRPLGDDLKPRHVR